MLFPRVVGQSLSPMFLCTLCALHTLNTSYTCSIQYCIRIHTNDKENNEWTMLMSKLELINIHLKRFACQNNNYKLTGTYQCEDTISSGFTLLQSNNSLYCNKFRKLAWGQESFVGGGAAPLTHRRLRPWIQVQVLK